MTLRPLITSFSARLLPMNPAPPVINTLSFSMNLTLHLLFRGFFEGCCNLARWSGQVESDFRLNRENIMKIRTGIPSFQKLNFDLELRWRTEYRTGTSVTSRWSFVATTKISELRVIPSSLSILAILAGKTFIPD